MSHCPHMEERDAALASARETTIALIQARSLCNELLVANRRNRRAFYGTLVVCAVMTMAAWFGWASYLAK